LKLGWQVINDGEANIATVVSQMTELLDGDDISIDYIKIANATTLEELTKPEEEMVALVAARVGSTRLIDNLLMFQPT
jgi:pantoate--beta-alanine ligase